jgi:SAM-dependent methyltransferase
VKIDRAQQLLVPKYQEKTLKHPKHLRTDCPDSTKQESITKSGRIRGTHEILGLAYLDCVPEQDRAVLDLACGSGRSGLQLTQRGMPVVFADRSANALNGIKNQLQSNGQPGRIWQVDLEQTGINPLANRLFSAVICFRYLHRPLIPALLKAIEPGGLVIYETFTSDNRRFGRPNNPDFLLNPGD